jgi:GNAT superfamily N-acetyltransferase
MINQIQIRPLIEKDIATIPEALKKIGWNKPASLFEGYLKEQEGGERLVWVAYFKGEFAGYVTLKWQSQYPSFKSQNIPEIMDLNVLPVYRKMGIGSLLLDRAEKEALTKSQIIGIGVVYMQVKMEAMELLKDCISNVAISLTEKALHIIMNPRFQVIAIRLMMNW